MFTEKIWHNVCNDSPALDFSLKEYRVKPEPNRVPFDNAKEIVDALNIHVNWIKNENGTWANPAILYRIEKLGTERPECFVLGQWFDTTDMLNNWTFMDGTPFGKIETIKI